MTTIPDLMELLKLFGQVPRGQVKAGSAMISGDDIKPRNNANDTVPDEMRPLRPRADS
jgi:hypothetical protein